VRHTLLFLFTLLLFFAMNANAQQCVTCHKQVTPNIVADWQVSKHIKNGVGCEICHGNDHTSAADVSKALIPTPETWSASARASLEGKW